MDKLARDNSIRLNWSLLTTSVANVKSCAENLLFLTGYVQGIPRVMGMLSLSSPAFGAILKPMQIFLSTIKDTASFVEAFEKVPRLLFGKVTKKETGSVYWGKRADAIAAGIEGFIMVPYRANLLPLGRFAGAIGSLSIVKDSIALVSIGCGFHVAGKKIERNAAKIEECQVRLKTLEKLQSLIKKNIWTIDELHEIAQLKRLYHIRQKDPEAKMRILHQKWHQETNLFKRQRLEKELAAMREKAFRQKVWVQNFDPQDASRLQDIISHKIVSRKTGEIRARNRIELAKVERRHSVTISFVIALGLVAQIGLYTTSSLLFLGQWIAGLTTGILGFSKLAAHLRVASAAELLKSPG